MKMRMIMLAMSLFSVSGLAYAEGGCLSGMIPYSGTDLSSCGPVPAGYYGNTNGQPSQPAMPQVFWIKTWGAIAIDDTLGKLGAVTGKRSKREAEKAAISHCIANEGGEACKAKGTVWAFKNQCAAVAWGETSISRAGGTNVESASQSALKECSAHTNNCEIVYTGCSEPVSTTSCGVLSWRC